MKELSIEEKAKRYDEAIKRVEDIVGGKCPKPFVFTEGLFDYIFPELKEREEEECKKWILEYLYDGLQKSDEQFKGQFNAAIAWLEKKGEQKSQGKLEDDVRRRSTIQVLEYARSLDTYNQYGKADIDKNIAWLEKQGEHKPADKEYTFKAIPRLLGMIPPTDRAKSYCQKLIDSLEQEGYSTDAKIVRDCLKQMNGEKVAMATMDEQKPAWSEEDEAHIMAIDLAVNRCLGKWYCCGEKCPISEHNPWLKCLKDRVQPQPKQEWSEEEIETCAREAEDNNCIILAKHIRQLKSLRPQSTWKPSDEQIKAVKEAACYSSVFSEKTIDNLISLSKQLKTLREE